MTYSSQSKQTHPTGTAGIWSSKITGTGSAFPEKRVTNEDLAKVMDTTDEWIRERTGIRERRIANPDNPNEHNSSLALRASLQALEMAGKTPDQIDAILYATCSPDTLVPSASCWLQQKLGAKNAWALDLNAACSGFVFGLSTADQFIKTGQVKTALVIGADILSAFTNWEDRTSAILFGDAAGAVVLERTEPNSPSRILSTHLLSDGSLWDLFHTPAGGSKLELTPERYAQKLGKMTMKGREMYKVAVKTLTDFAQIALKANGFTVQDADWIVPHQANLRIIEAVAKRLEVPMEKVLVNIDRYGNTSAATVPTVLDENVRNGRIRPGQLLVLDVFGAGLTYGSILLRW